uniref:AP2/ERF domain-containing protein n=1 Tax=Skeletonema marinoi TaxID=267567 RepID=A0A7S2P2U4_9STRA|mmetsp:Transcript_11393/g.19407  ORF Transcript_11393/g.19407 Transcript_11393/m.19407 type:complete len:193 (+) Transcript_11393:213-791(+)
MMMIRSMTAKRLVVKKLRSFVTSKVVKVKPPIEESVMSALHTMMCFSTMNDDTTDDTTDEGEGEAIDACGHNNSMKRPHALVDADGTEEKKRRKRTQKLIDLTDVPAQPPILKSSRKGTSKYHGVSKASKKWKAQIAIDGKTHYIGNYDNEEQAGIDYARAVFKYNSTRKRTPFFPLGPLPLPDPKEMEKSY